MIIKNKKWNTLLTLSIFLGMYGVDRFYAGKIFSGILKLCLCFFCFYLVLGKNLDDDIIYPVCAWYLIDIILIIKDKFPIKKYIELTKEEEKQERRRQRIAIEKEKQRQLIANAEYKRTCKACGSVWHSSVSQENSGPGTVASRLGLAGAIALGSLRSTPGAIITFNQWDRIDDKEAAYANYLHSVRHCPKCGSNAYYQEVVSY